MDLSESMKYFQNLVGDRLKALSSLGFRNSGSGLFCVSFNEILRGFGNEFCRLIKPGRSALARVLVVFVSGLLLGGVGICGSVCADIPKPSEVNENTDPKVLRRYVKAIDRMIEMKGPSASSYSTKGQILEWLKQYAEAVSAYSKAIRLDSDNSSYYLYRARCLRKLRRHVLAETDYSVAIKLRKYTPEVYTGRALSRMALRNYKGSIADALSATKLDPNEDLAWYAKAYSEFKLGRLESSIQSISRAIELKPHDSGFYSLRSDAYRNKGDLAKAEEDLALCQKYERDQR